MSDSSTAYDRDHEHKAKMEEFYFQRRLLFGCTVSLLVAIIMWIIAMSTNRWYMVVAEPRKSLKDEICGRLMRLRWVSELQPNRNLD